MSIIQGLLWSQIITCVSIEPNQQNASDPRGHHFQQSWPLGGLLWREGASAARQNNNNPGIASCQSKLESLCYLTRLRERSVSFLTNSVVSTVQLSTYFQRVADEKIISMHPNTKLWLFLMRIWTPITANNFSCNMTSAIQAATYFSPFFSFSHNVCLFVCLLSEMTRRNSLGLEHARDAIAPTTATFIRKQKNINVQ